MIKKNKKIHPNKRTFPRYKFYRRYQTDLHSRLRLSKKLNIRTCSYLIETFFSRLSKRRSEKFQHSFSRKRYDFLFQKYTTWKKHLRSSVYRVDGNNKIPLRKKDTWQQTLLKLKTFFSKFYRQSRTKLSKRFKKLRNFSGNFSLRENRVVGFNKKNHLLHQAKFFPFMMGLFILPDSHKYLYDKKSFILRRGIMDSSMQIPAFTFLFIRGPLQRFFKKKLEVISAQHKKNMRDAFIRQFLLSNFNLPEELREYPKDLKKVDGRRFSAKYARFCYPEAMTFFPAAFCFYYRGHTPFFKEPYINTGMFESLSRVPYSLSTIVFN